MGRFERRPDNMRGKGDPYGAAETAIRAVTEELQVIQRNLLKSLQEDVKRLEAEKNRLRDDIERLQEEKQQLQQEQQVTEQHTLLIRQLSQVLANHISSQLQSSVEKLVNQAVERVPQEHESVETAEVNKNAEKFLDSLDDTLTITFNSLQQEIRNYQSNLSQQLSRMHNQQQQGEAILAELVNRLHREMETTQETPLSSIELTPSAEHEVFQPPQQSFFSAPTKLQLDVSPPQEVPSVSSPSQDIASESEPIPFSSPPAPEPTPTPSPPPEPVTQVKPRQPLSQMDISSLPFMGICLIVLSVVASSLYNVAIKIIFHPGTQIFGSVGVERLISPNLGNSLLILMLRMLVVVPLMLLLAPILHSRVWDDLQYLVGSVRQNTSNTTAKRLLILSIFSGCFLFLSQLLLYLAIGHVATGMAIALFFVYPVLSVLFSWVLFRERLSIFSTSAIASIGIGELLVLGGAVNTGMVNLPLGSIAAILSGVAFAVYVILSRICAAKLHPVTFILINFATMLVLSVFGLILPLPKDWSIQINPTHFLELVLSAFMLGVLTLGSYLLNNFGIRKIGASRSAIIGAAVPALTVILASFIIQETLGIEQVLGVLLVTFGAGILSFEKIKNQFKASKSPN